MIAEVFIGRSIGGTTTGASASSVALSFTSPATFERQGLLVTAIGSDAYVGLAMSSASAPTVSSTAYDFHIPQGSTMTLTVGRSITPYITSTGSYSAKEIQ